MPSPAPLLGLASIRFDPILPFLASLCGDLGFSAVFRFTRLLFSDFWGLGFVFPLSGCLCDLYLDRNSVFGYGLFGLTLYGLHLHGVVLGVDIFLFDLLIFITYLLLLLLLLSRILGTLSSLFGDC